MPLPAPPRPRTLGPTAKVLAALAVTVAAAAGIGSLIGLPLPGTGTEGGNRAASLLPGGLDAGTAPLNPDGPFYPVMGPVDYGQLAAHFGGGRDHPGQDMLTTKGTPLVAVRSGTIIDEGTTNSQYSGGRGNYIYLWSPQDKRTYVYLHMVRPSPLKLGEKVVAGQYVGRVGCTGSCDGPHLHFEIRLGYDDLGHDPKPINPLPLLRTWTKPPPEALVGNPGPGGPPTAGK
jgi:murein DD-endopeptidase MepM/ murein hydrolase activator NlpD